MRACFCALSLPRSSAQEIPAAVLNFRRHSNVPNYLGSKQQRRWLALLASAGIVAILVFQSRGWFAPDDPHSGRGETLRPQSNEQDEASAPAGRNAFFPGVRPDYLREVRDDDVFRAAETDAWFHLLAILEKTDERRLEDASLGRVGYVQLDRQAPWYRGRLVTIAGVVRSARLVDAPENDYGIERYYQLWLQPERSSPELVVVYCLHLPEGFPLGARLDAQCAASGFFFKRWAYQSASGVTTAPLILARSVDWQRPPAVPPPAPLGEQLILALVAALVVAVLIVGYFVARTRGAPASRQPADARRVEAALASLESQPSAERRDIAGDEEIAGS
jgi:hypothetical protein